MKIGDKVQWTVGKITRIGLFYQTNGETSTVRCIQAGTKLMNIKCEVPAKLLSKVVL